MSERLPPFSEEAERGALGSMLLDGLRVLPLATTTLKLPADAFYLPAHRTIYEAILGVAERGADRVDLLTVTNALKEQGLVERIGGATALDRLVDVTPTSAHAEYYLDIVRQKWLARRAMGIAQEILEDGYGCERGDELLRQAPGRFHEATSDVVKRSDNDALMGAAIAGWREAARRRRSGDDRPMIACDTPWRIVTELMCGLEVGLTILAGRPSAGKTTMEDILACHVAAAGKPVLRVTLDGSARELLERALCRSGQVSLPHLKFGFGGEAKFALMEEARAKLKNYPLVIVENLVDIRDIETAARMHVARDGVGLITVDYLQQVHAFADMGRDDRDTVARTTWISGKLKRLSLELGIPVLCLSQLSRDVEKENRDPKLSDLRDSGAIEQDAHKVVFLYRGVKKCREMEQASPGATKHKRPVWFDVMKGKDNETGRIPMWMYPPYFRFEPATTTDWSDDALPSSRGHVDEGYARAPEYLPADEGGRRGGEVSGVGEDGEE